MRYISQKNVEPLFDKFPIDLMVQQQENEFPSEWGGKKYEKNPKTTHTHSKKHK